MVKDETTGPLIPPGIIPLLERSPSGEVTKMLIQALLVLVPVIFAAGMVWYNFTTVSLAVRDHEVRIKQFEAQTNELKSDQRLFSANLTNMTDSQKQIETAIKDIQGKLDQLTVDVATIKARMNPRRQ